MTDSKDDQSKPELTPWSQIIRRPKRPTAPDAGSEGAGGFVFDETVASRPDTVRPRPDARAGERPAPASVPAGRAPGSVQPGPPPRGGEYGHGPTARPSGATPVRSVRASGHDDPVAGSPQAVRGRTFVTDDTVASRPEAVRGRTFATDDTVASSPEAVRGRTFATDDTVASSPEAVRGRTFATDDTMAGEPSAVEIAEGVTMTSAPSVRSLVDLETESGPDLDSGGFGRRPSSHGGRTPSHRTGGATGHGSASHPSAPPSQSGSLPSASEDGAFELPGYRIIRFFGQGGMGEVFLADRLSSTGVTVRCVVKTIREGVGDREQFENLFLDEARIVSHLRHPNIVSTIDVGRAGGRLYLAMEWIDGLDAGKLAKEAASRGSDIPLPHVLYVLRETLQGLHYAHTAVGPDGQPLRIVHRDISQGNILISKHGAVKLADFGVAVGTAARTAGSAESLAGKPHYFAPELWRGARASVQTDIFALGVTFYELLASRPLFQRNVSMAALTYEICNFDVERLLEEDLTIPDGIEEIVRRSLHPDLSQRYATALEFLEDVNDYAYEYGIRLLDAHFGGYVERMLMPEVEPAGRKRLWKD